MIKHEFVTRISCINYLTFDRNHSGTPHYHLFMNHFTLRCHYTLFTTFFVWEIKMIGCFQHTDHTCLIHITEHICFSHSHTKCSKNHLESFCLLACMALFDIVSLTYGNSILKRFLQKGGKQEITKVVSFCKTGWKTWKSAPTP